MKNNWMFLPTWTVLLLAASLIAVTGCTGKNNSALDSWFSTQAPPIELKVGACDLEFSRLSLPKKIDGHKKIIFSLSDLQLDTPNLQLDSVVLNVQYDGKKQQTSSLAIGVNGLLAASRDGTPLFKGHGKPKDDDDYDDVDIFLHRATLKGVTSFAHFLVKITESKGELAFTLQGGNFKILSAKLTLHGVIRKSCDPQPTPTPSTSPTPHPDPSASPTPTPFIPEPTPTPIPAVPPITTILYEMPSDSVTASTSMNIGFAADQVGVSYTCQLNAEPPAPCTSPQTYSNLENGLQVFKVWATSAAALSDVNPPTYSWTVHSQIPSVFITPLPTLSHSTSISLSFSTSESSITYCSLDGGPVTFCTSPVAYFGLGEGAHSVAIAATNVVGTQTLTPALFSWTIDLTAPTTQLTQVVPAESPNNSSQMRFEFGASESSSFQCSVDGGTFNSCTSPFLVSNVTHGNHVLQVQATDVAENIGPIASYSWTADFLPPLLTLRNTVPTEGPNSSHLISVEFTSNEISTFSCQFDDEAAVSCVSPFTKPVAIEGFHQLRITPRDMAGNIGEMKTLNWNMDFTAPPISFGLILPSTSSAINSTHMSFEVQTTEPVKLRASLDGEPMGELVSPILLDDISEGPHTLVIDGEDLAGNAANTLTHAFTIDTTAPVLSLSGLYKNIITSQNINTLSFFADEDANFRCELDGSGFTVCQSPLNLSGLADGVHNFSVEVYDLAGNKGTTKTLTWTVDSVAPNTTLTAVQTDNTSMTFTFSSSETQSTFSCALDNGPASSCTSPLSLASLPAGNHVLSVRAIDSAGNIDPTGAFAAFVILPPVNTQLGLVNPAGSYIAQQTITLAFSSNHPAAVFQCRLDNSVATPCVSPMTYSALVQGLHTFKVQATDEFGTPDSTGGVVYSFTVDTISPSVALATSTKTSTNITSAQFTFTANEPSTFECRVDTATFTPCLSPVTLSGLSAGNHTYQVRAIDWAGNQSTAASFTWTIDLTPPTTTVQATKLDRAKMSFALSASEANSTFRCALDGAALQPCVSPFVLNSISNGIHTFKTVATDPAGNADPIGGSVSFPIYPEISTIFNGATPSTALINVNSLTLQFSANQPGATFQCTLDTNVSSCTSPWTYSNLGQGPHVFNVRAIDSFGHMDSVGVSYSFTVDTQAPTTTASGVLTAATTMQFTFASSELGSQFICALDSGASVNCISPYSISNLSSGPHSLKVRAIDLAGNMDSIGATVTFDIPPTVKTTLNSATPSTPTITQSSITFAFSSNLTDATFQCSLDGAAATTCTTPWTYNSLSSANHQFVVRAIDRFGNMDPIGASYSFQVNTECNISGLSILNVAATNITRTTVTITWQTSAPATSQVENTVSATGVTTTTPLDSTKLVSHSVTLTGLTSNTLYSANALSTTCGFSAASSVLYRTTR